MKKLRLFFWIAFVFVSCSRFGQFQDSMDQLTDEWEVAKSAQENLVDKIEREEERLDELTRRYSPRVGLVGNFGEDYLSREDQASARLVGHKERFDALLAQIRATAGEWAAVEEEIIDLEQKLRAGALPADVPGRIRDLQAFVKEGKEKVDGWDQELDEVIQQVDAAVRQLEQ